MDYVLTLVHGTWADTKGWVAPGSFLRRELERRLATDGTPKGAPYVQSPNVREGVNVVFREFAWAGTNTHAARTEAGARLADFILAGYAQHPAARHIIIAHSHGGNVALYAMRDPAAREAVDGIVTLATPFIHVKPRDPHRYAGVVAWLMLGAAALASFVLLDALKLAWAPLAWLAASVVLLMTMKPRLTRWVNEAATREQTAIVAALQPGSIDCSKLMVLCARGDEVRTWLRTWEVAAHGTFATGCALLWLVAASARSNLPAAADGAARSALHAGLDQVRLFGFDALTLIVGLLVLCGLGALVLMCSTIFRWPGFGREPLLANALVDVGTSPIPDAGDGCSHRAHMWDVPSRTPWSRITRGGLRHTAICDDAAVVAAIGDRIACKLRPSNPSSSQVDVNRGVRHQVE